MSRADVSKTGLSSCRHICLIAVLLGYVVGWGDVLPVDVDAWGLVGTGTTPDGWTVRGIDAYSAGGVYFNAKGDESLSPLFPGLVTQVVARVKSSAASMTRFLSLLPRTAQPDARTFQAQPTKDYQEQTFAWNPAELVRQFAFQVVGTNSGNWGVSEVTVYVDRVDRPSNLRTGALYADAFEAKWDAEPRAVRFEIGAGSVQEVEPSYLLHKRWDFSVLTNTTGNTRDMAQLHPPEALGDVGGEALCLQANAGGHLQIGKSDVAGVMVLPVPAGEGRTALVTAFRHVQDKPDGDMPVEVVTSTGVTNALPSPRLTVIPTELRLALPDGATRLLLHSRGTRRVRVVDVAIVSDYVAGSLSTNWIKSRFAMNTECVVKNLFPGQWLWRVRAFDDGDCDSPWSAPLAVTLEGKRPLFDERGLGLVVR